MHLYPWETQKLWVNCLFLINSTVSKCIKRGCSSDGSMVVVGVELFVVVFSCIKRSSPTSNNSRNNLVVNGHQFSCSSSSNL